VVESKRAHNVRSCGGIEQNVSVLEVLGFRAVLEVLLQAVAALVAADGRDWCLVDDYGRVVVFRSHGELESV
jgi:hypothetical protein